MNITETNRDAFDIDPCVVITCAELLSFFRIDEFSVDNSILPLPPLEELEIFLIFCLIMKIDLIFLNFLAGEIVSIDIIEPMLYMKTSLRILYNMPALSFERRGLIGFRLFITHLIIKFYNLL